MFFRFVYAIFKTLEKSGKTLLVADTGRLIKSRPSSEFVDGQSASDLVLNIIKY